MRSVPLILALALLVAGCDDESSPTQPSPVTTTVTLAPGAQTNALGLTILFERVVDDSRCPADALCVAPGDAIVSLNLSAGGVGTRYDLYVNDVTRRRVTYRSYEVELATLQPYPLASQPTDPTAYRVTLQVTQTGE